MIDDGPEYKLLLYRAVKRFELDLARCSWPRKQGSEDALSYWRVRFEDTLFRVGLGVRKLIEAAKLSVEVQEQPINVTFIPVRGERYPGALDQHHIDKFYDVEAARSDRIPVMILCHAIVHSYVLVPRFVGSGRGGLRLQDFYLASDRGRKKGVYLIDWRTFVDELVSPATSDDVVGMIMRRLPNGEELRIPTSRTDLPTGVEDRLAELYSGLSQSDAKSFDKFMEEWRKAYGTPPDPTPRD